LLEVRLHSPAVFVQEVICQARYVFGHFAKRWRLDVNHLRAALEIFAKPSFFDRAFQVLVGGRSHARIIELSQKAYQWFSSGTDGLSIKAISVVRQASILSQSSNLLLA
jgi:hypothetical protein